MKFGTPKRLILSVAVLCALAGISSSVYAQAEKTTEERSVNKGTLKVGDKAPKIEVEKWVKGKPIEKYEDGQIYVVEFWATWCGPCIRNIPHLTEMQKEYKDKVRFVGVSIWEESREMDDGKYLDRVESFVKDMGDKMDYTVAFGGEGAKMAKTWMEAANRPGIPSAFIVKNGTVQWIGHPGEMKKTLDQVVAGNFDPSKVVDTEKAQRDANAGYKTAMRAENYADALKYLDQMIDMDEAMAENPGVVAQRFQLLYRGKDADSAYKYAKKMSDGPFKNDPMVLNALAWNILDSEWVTKRDLDYAMDIAKKADKAADHKNAAILDTLARAYYEKKDMDKAVEIQTKAVKAAADNDEDDMQAELEETLAKYKKAAGK